MLRTTAAILIMLLWADRLPAAWQQQRAVPGGTLTSAPILLYDLAGRAPTEAQARLAARRLGVEQVLRRYGFGADSRVYAAVLGGDWQDLVGVSDNLSVERTGDGYRATLDLTIDRARVEQRIREALRDRIHGSFYSVFLVAGDARTAHLPQRPEQRAQAMEGVLQSRLEHMDITFAGRPGAALAQAAQRLREQPPTRPRDASRFEALYLAAAADPAVDYLLAGEVRVEQLGPMGSGMQARAAVWGRVYDSGDRGLLPKTFYGSVERIGRDAGDVLSRIYTAAAREIVQTQVYALLAGTDRVELEVRLCGLGPAPREAVETRLGTLGSVERQTPAGDGGAVVRLQLLANQDEVGDSEALMDLLDETPALARFHLRFDDAGTRLLLVGDGDDTPDPGDCR